MGLPPNVENEDDDLYIPPNSKSKKQKSADCDAKMKNMHKVRPSLNGRDSIPWNELTECKLECHLCDKVYTQQNGGRIEYIEHLKAHYNDTCNDLTYLECELCLSEPTKNNLKKKKAHILNGTALCQPNLWRTSSHVANFIS